MAIKSHISVCCAVIIFLNLEQRSFLWNLRAGLLPQERTATLKCVFQPYQEEEKKRSKMQGAARSKIIFSLFYWAIWGKEGQVEQTEISVQQVGTTGKKCSPKPPPSHSLEEKSSTFEARLLIRLHFRALVRTKNVRGIKCYLHIKLKRENVAQDFLLPAKYPLWSHWSGSVSGPGAWSSCLIPQLLCSSALEQPLQSDAHFQQSKHST